MVSILVGIVSLVLIVLILASVVGVAGIKRGSVESSERGSEMIKTVYVYLILFATLMMTIGGTVAAFMAVADIVSPPPYGETFAQYQLAPQYKVDPSSSVNPTPQSDAELKKQYDQMIADQNLVTKQRAINSLIKSFGWIVIPLPVFLYFQNRMKKQPV